MNKFRLMAISLARVGSIAVIVLLGACQKPKAVEPKPPPQPESNSQPVVQQVDSTVIKVGNNPYSVKAMRQAWTNLQAQRKNSGDSAAILVGDEFSIQTSHLYLRFKPKDEAELNLLEQDSTLELFGYPIDNAGVSDSIRQLFDEGKVYRDEGVPESQPPYQYCAVPLEASLPQVDYEILDSLFIPDEDIGAIQIEQDTSLVPALVTILDDKDSLVMDLVRESLIITDNLDTSLDKVARRCGRYVPSGTIRVWDRNVTRISTTRMELTGYATIPCSESGDAGESEHDECQRPLFAPVTRETPVPGTYLPVVGVTVRARRWFITKKGTTNADGYYRCSGSYLRPANYSLKWERYDFSIRQDYFVQATVNAGKRCGSWSYDIGRQGSDNVNDKQQYYALIFQAASDYYYGNILGLQRPPRRGSGPLAKQVKIAARLENGTSRAKPWSPTGLIPTISIRVFNRQADWVYGTTIHELTHLAHWELDVNAYKNLLYDGYTQGLFGDKAVVESWATGVEILITNRRYRQIGDADYLYEDNFQD